MLKNYVAGGACPPDTYASKTREQKDKFRKLPEGGNLKYHLLENAGNGGYLITTTEQYIGKC